LYTFSFWAFEILLKSVTISSVATVPPLLANPTTAIELTTLFNKRRVNGSQALADACIEAVFTSKVPFSVTLLLIKE
jgi:hypothetical protein